MENIVIVSAARTAIGDFGGALRDVAPTELGIVTAKAALARAGITGAEVDQVFYGNVIHGEHRDMYVSRTIAIGAGVGVNAPALTVNRLCGSGLQAIVSGIQAIAMQDADIVLAGGAESMSRAGYLTPSLRWGQKMGDTAAIDMMTSVLTDPFGHGHMGVTAENVAAKFNVPRQDQDAFAVESHRRAAHAIAAGYFKDEIEPVVIQTRRGDVIFDTDEHVRAEASVEDMAKLLAAFQKDGTVTAGNASGLNDGAASVLLMSERAAIDRGLTPLARIKSYGVAGVEPALMGMGPVPAMQRALDRAGITIADLDIIESNEAFAAQACAVAGQLGLDPARVNPNGGAIALGHPIGASGAIITTKLVYEMRRRGAKLGAATMCIGGGQGIALILENVSE